jgi:hypothetical protein
MVPNCLAEYAFLSSKVKGELCWVGNHHSRLYECKRMSKERCWCHWCYDLQWRQLTWNNHSSFDIVRDWKSHRFPIDIYLEGIPSWEIGWCFHFKLHVVVEIWQSVSIFWGQENGIVWSIPRGLGIMISTRIAWHENSHCTGTNHGKVVIS